MNNAETHDLLRLLEDTARKLGVEVRYDNLSDNNGENGTKGGLCKLKGVNLIFIDRLLPTPGKCAVIAEALSSFDLSLIFVPPVVRQAVKKASDKRS